MFKREGKNSSFYETDSKDEITGKYRINNEGEYAKGK